jgi:hypothetical protein
MAVSYFPCFFSSLHSTRWHGSARPHTTHNGSSPLPSFLRRSRSPMHQCAEAEQKQPPSMPTIHLSVAKLARLPHEKLLAR